MLTNKNSLIEQIHFSPCTFLPLSTFREVRFPVTPNISLVRFDQITGNLPTRIAGVKEIENESGNLIVVDVSCPPAVRCGRQRECAERIGSVGQGGTQEHQWNKMTVDLWPIYAWHVSIYSRRRRRRRAFYISNHTPQYRKFTECFTLACVNRQSIHSSFRRSVDIGKLAC